MGDPAWAARDIGAGTGEAWAVVTVKVHDALRADQRRDTCDLSALLVDVLASPVSRRWHIYPPGTGSVYRIAISQKTGAARARAAPLAIHLSCEVGQFLLSGLTLNFSDSNTPFATSR